MGSGSRFARRAQVWIVGLVALAMAGGAGVHGRQDADMKELSAYRLSAQGLQQYRAVMRALVTEVKKDPRFQEMGRISEEIERLDAKDELTAADEKRLEALEQRLEQLEEQTNLSMSEGSLNEIEARIRKHPSLSAAVKAGGMSPRDYAKFTLSLFQASMAVGMKRAGLMKELPKDVPAENVAFVEQHAAELEQMQKELEALAPRERDR